MFRGRVPHLVTYDREYRLEDDACGLGAAGTPER